MIRQPVIALIALSLAAAATAPAEAQWSDAASAKFTSGSEAFSRGDFAAAVSDFEAALAAGMTGPAIHYNIGVSYYRLGDYARAEEAFRALVADYPDMRALAEYNLGLALNRQNRAAEARAAFERASRSSDEAIARLATEMLARLSASEPEPASPAWLRLFDVAVGHDDNVALVDEASVPAGQSTDSPFAEVFGLVTGRLGRSSALRFDASGYLVRYDDAPEFDQETLRVGLAYLADWPLWSLDIGPHYNYSALDGQGFERRLGVTLSARHPVGEQARVLLRFTHDEVDETSSEFAFVAGSRDRLGIGVERRHERGRLEVGYVHEQNDRADPGVSPTRHELFAGYEHALTADWSVELQGLLRSSRYDDLTVPRDEDLSQLSVTATRDFDSGWQLVGEYRVADNSSNVEQFSYDRNRLVVGLNRLF